MTKLFLSFLFAIIFQSFPASGQDTTEIFYDIHWKPVRSKSYSFYYRKAWRTAQGLFEANDYYTRNKQLQMSGLFSDAAFTVQSGQFNFYYYGGQKKSTTQYDSLGLATGKSYGWYENGRIEEETSYTGDSLNGPYVAYHPNGQVYITAFFDNGAVSNEQYYSDDGSFLGGKPEKAAEYNGGTEQLNGYLSCNVRYPEPAREASVEGRVIVRFCVSNKGVIHKIFIQEHSGNNLLDAEAVRAIEQMPPWQPATYQGKPVESYFTLPVAFQLD